MRPPSDGVVTRFFVALLLRMTFLGQGSSREEGIDLLPFFGGELEWGWNRTHHLHIDGVLVSVENLLEHLDFGCDCDAFGLSGVSWVLSLGQPAEL